MDWMSSFNGFIFIYTTLDDLWLLDVAIPRLIDVVLMTWSWFN